MCKFAQLYACHELFLKYISPPVTTTQQAHKQHHHIDITTQTRHFNNSIQYCIVVHHRLQANGEKIIMNILR